jgi:hypothetical protein
MRCYSVDSAKGSILPVFETVPACIPTTKTAHWLIFEPITQQQNPCSSGHMEGARCSGMAAAHLAKKRTTRVRTVDTATVEYPISTLLEKNTKNNVALAAI